VKNKKQGELKGEGSCLLAY